MQVHDNTNSRATADIIFTGGQVHTVNTTNDIVEAVAVGGGRILAVGSTAEIRALAGSGTREIELRGRSLLPGFIDAHCHLTGLGMAMVSIDCKAPGMHIDRGPAEGGLRACGDPAAGDVDSRARLRPDPPARKTPSDS